MSSGGDEIETLIATMARLPGLGPRSARRVVLHLIRKRAGQMAQLASLMANVAENARECLVCGNITQSDICPICEDPSRASGEICVVTDVADLWALERGRAFRGRYHVLGGSLSALDEIGPDDLRITQLMQRLADGTVQEVILATNPNLEGEATATYLSRLIVPMGVTVSRLASGLPVGGDLEYADEVTLGRAFEGRRVVHG